MFFIDIPYFIILGLLVVLAPWRLYFLTKKSNFSISILILKLKEEIMRQFIEAM
jgi:hypothetical protein